MARRSPATGDAADGRSGADKKPARGRPKRAPAKPAAPPGEDAQPQLRVTPLVAWEEAQLLPQQQQQPATPPPGAPQVFFLLTGGGTNVGKRAFSGQHASFLRLSPTKTGGASHTWCRMQLRDSGEELAWARRFLLEQLPDGSYASEAPSVESLLSLSSSAARGTTRSPPPAVAAPPAARKPTRCLPSTPGTPVVVLFDLESRGGSNARGPSSWRITEMAAQALRHTELGARARALASASCCAAPAA
jgi:hypothetical protein